MTFLLGLVPSFIPPQFRKAFVFGALALLAIAAFFGAKALYDRSVIRNHDAKREAATAKADRKADEKAAVQRRADDARLSTETAEIKEAVDEARREKRDPRAAYYECLTKQQAARRANSPSVPDC